MKPAKDSHIVPLENVARTIIHEGKKRKWDVETTKEIADSFTISGHPLLELVQMDSKESLPEIKYIKALYRIQDNFETNNSGFITCPKITMKRPQILRTAGGLKYITSNHDETVNFKYGDVKGNFSHAKGKIFKSTVCKKKTTKAAKEQENLH
jgi:hypothetical protein